MLGAVIIFTKVTSPVWGANNRLIGQINTTVELSALAAASTQAYATQVTAFQRWLNDLALDPDCCGSS
jgi:hypothetical protein